MPTLFDPIRLGDYALKNRIFMAPLTRGRAGVDGVPGAMMAEYYAQRAEAGLLIAEATAINAQGHGWRNSPGIYTDAQVIGWRRVTDAVHANDGRIFQARYEEWRAKGARFATPPMHKGAGRSAAKAGSGRLPHRGEPGHR